MKHKSKLKIAFLSQLDDNLYLFRLPWIKNLIHQGHDIYVIVPSGDYSKKLKAMGINVLHYNIKRGNINPFSELKTLFELYHILKKKHIDLLQTSYHKPNIYGSFLGRLVGIPVIVNFVGGLGYLYTENNIKVRFLRFLTSFLLKASFRLSDKTIFMNKDDVYDLGYSLGNSKIELISGPGVDVDYFSSKRISKLRVNSIKRKLSIDKSSLVVLFVGRLLLHKGINEFVKSADILCVKYPNLVFLVAGWVDKENPSAVTLDTDNITHRNKNIIFLGKKDNIDELLALADIFVLPSYREAGPVSILEAMSMEKPVVTTDVPGCRDRVKDGYNGFLVPIKDAVSLASAVERLILDKGLRVKMGINGRKMAINKFSSKFVVKQVMGIYNKLIPDRCLL